jgi:hypothetical protein
MNCTLAKATSFAASIMPRAAKHSFDQGPSMLHRITTSRTACSAHRSNLGIRALVGLFRAGSIVLEVGGIYLALAIFAAAASGVQWLIG